MAVTVKKNKPSWMKTGDEAKKVIQKEEAKAKQAAEQMDKLRRFYIPNGAETKITFLDGDLDDSGVLQGLMFYEHNLFMNGSWKNWFTCVQEEEPCPICEGGNDAKLVIVFTVIDHSEWTSPNTNKTYKDQKKLFVCKRNTFKMLQKKAAKQGGLRGCTFDVSRTGDKEASVGNDFDFEQKRTLEEIGKAYPELKGGATPADYEEEIPYHTADELRQMGFGSEPVGASSGSGAATKDLSSEL